MKRSSRAPLAITSDDVLANLSELMREPDRECALRMALRSGADVFVGVRLTAAENAGVLARIDNALAEAAARVVGSTTAARRDAKQAHDEVLNVFGGCVVGATDFVRGRREVLHGAEELPGRNTESLRECEHG